MVGSEVTSLSPAANSHRTRRADFPHHGPAGKIARIRPKPLLGLFVAHRCGIIFIGGMLVWVIMWGRLIFTVYVFNCLSDIGL